MNQDKKVPTQRELLAAALLAVGNMGVTLGLSYSRLGGNEEEARAPRFDEFDDNSALALALATKAVPGFLAALETSPMREDLLAAADVLLGAAEAHTYRE